jgi:glycosyltransferase involved in cell wall biosynthesis
VRIIALLATFNEQRFIVGCLEHLIRDGIDVYLIDNESTDDTVNLAHRFLGRGLLGIETMSRAGRYPWKLILERKAALASELDADWFMHVDADEISCPPAGDRTLGDAIARVDATGDNAINFLEYTFVPTRQSPDHDHSDYLRTMRWYYPFLPAFPNRLKAWKRQRSPVDLASSSGHVVAFPGVRMHETSFPMRHYLFLSVQQAIGKYVGRPYDPDEIAKGWHRARVGMRPEDIWLQDESDLRVYRDDASLDPSNPLQKHPLFTRGMQRLTEARS